MESESTTYSITSRTAYRVIDDEVVIVHPTEQRLLTLNGTGSRVWRLLESHRSFEQLFEEMLEIHDVAAERLDADLRSFLDTLVREGLISAKETSTPR